MIKPRAAPAHDVVGLDAVHAQDQVDHVAAQVVLVAQRRGDVQHGLAFADVGEAAQAEVGAHGEGQPVVLGQAAQRAQLRQRPAVVEVLALVGPAHAQVHRRRDRQVGLAAGHQLDALAVRAAGLDGELRARRAAPAHVRGDPAEHGVEVRRAPITDHRQVDARPLVLVLVHAGLQV